MVVRNKNGALTALGRKEVHLWYLSASELLRLPLRLHAAGRSSAGRHLPREQSDARLPRPCNSGREGPRPAKRCGSLDVSGVGQLTNMSTNTTVVLVDADVRTTTTSDDSS